MIEPIKKRAHLLFFLYSSLFLCHYSFSQDKDLIQFSGVIVEADSLRPVPFTHVIIKNSNRGTMADYYGYFSFVAKKSDTIIFSALGFKNSQYAIPDSLVGNKYSLIQVLRTDTLYLNTAVIYPWPTPEEFKKVFLEKNIPDDDLARAKKNLEAEAMRERSESMPMDGSMNYKNYMNQQNSRLYYAGQYPVNNLLNPFAWAQFIKAWREGKLKVQTPKDNGSDDEK